MVSREKTEAVAGAEHEAVAGAEHEAGGPPARIRGTPYSLTVLGVAIGSLALFVLLRSTPIDDAYISFRYLDQWLRGNGLVFNPGDRVEGYSNLLWILVLAAPVSVASLASGSPAPPGLLPGISVAFELALATGTVLLLVIATERVTRRRSLYGPAAALLLAVNVSYVFWIGKGLETILYAFLQLLFAFLVLRLRECCPAQKWSGVLLGLVGGALALTRPEGVVAPVIVLAALAARERRQRRLCLWALAMVVALALAQIVFRLGYYGAWLPNTYYAKRLPLGQALDSGLLYLREFTLGISPQGVMVVPGGWAAQLTTVIVCAAAGLGAASRWGRLWPVVLQALALIGLGVALGGDWMPAFRFFMPAIPLGCLLLAAGLSGLAGDPPLRTWRRMCAPLLVAALLSVEVYGAAQTVRSFDFGFWRHSVRNYRAMAKELADHARPGSLVALSDIGTISYYNPALRFLDVLGLTDAHIASLPGRHYFKTDLEYVLARQPDYVLVMLADWLDGRTRTPKTDFDGQFVAHPAARQDYESVALIRGWRISTEDEYDMLFSVYQRRRPGRSADGRQ